jgi:hypothetical protein
MLIKPKATKFTHFAVLDYVRCEHTGYLRFVPVTMRSPVAFSTINGALPAIAYCNSPVWLHFGSVESKLNPKLWLLYVL